ncbi:MAG: glycosyltransferase family 4 protein [Flavobacteriaceae bacterium]|nr:glycosyltransferase family 4 protein [Flavobacteriaceae bacterium]
MKKRTVLVAHGFWGRGGAEIATMYLIEALRETYKIHIITRGGWDLNELNNFAKTSVLPSEITMIKLPFASILKQTFAGHIWHALFLSYCRKIASKYDIRVTASRVMGWGKPAIHFLSDVVWNDELVASYGNQIIEPKGLKKILLLFGKTIAGKAQYQLHKDDVFIANSYWTSKLSTPYTSTKPIVIYPPVAREFNKLSWNKRLNSFISLGRISPEKKIEDTITIITDLRKKGFDLNLTIIGQFGNDDYSKKIEIEIKNKPWITALGPLHGDEITSLLPQFKYGINTCLREAFGISTAEMYKAGIITFVPQQGAQHEIIGDKNLIFSDIQDATNKIESILKSEELQLHLIDNIIKKKKDFSSEKFKNEVLKIFNLL